MPGAITAIFCHGYQLHNYPYVAPIWYFGCFELLPENNLGEKIFKARHYLGMIRKEFVQKIGVTKRIYYIAIGVILRSKDVIGFVAAVTIVVGIS